MIIRKATLDDAKKILEYLKIVGGESDNLTFGNEGINLSIEEEQNYLKNILHSSSNLCIVADDNERIVGVLNLIANSKNRLLHNSEIGVSVIKEYWHKGIGSKLLQYAIEFAMTKGIENINLTVKSDNENAIKLYQKFGFKKVGTLYRYLKINNEYYDCDLMQLFLK